VVYKLCFNGAVKAGVLTFFDLSLILVVLFFCFYNSGVILFFW